MVGSAGLARPDIFNLYLDFRASQPLQVCGGHKTGPGHHNDISSDAWQSAGPDLRYLEAEVVVDGVPGCWKVR